jgi:hypothetical protein
MVYIYIYVYIYSFLTHTQMKVSDQLHASTALTQGKRTYKSDLNNIV